MHIPDDHFLQPGDLDDHYNSVLPPHPSIYPSINPSGLVPHPVPQLCVPTFAEFCFWLTRQPGSVLDVCAYLDRAVSRQNISFN